MTLLSWAPSRRNAVRATPAGDLLRVLVRCHLGPLLTSHGLRGSGSAWALPSDTHWVMVGIEQHVEHGRQAREDVVHFAPRLAVVSRADWNLANQPRGTLPEVPPATVPHGVGWERRLGSLLPDGDPGLAWSLRAGQDLLPLAVSLRRGLAVRGLPALRDELERERRRRPTCSASFWTDDDCSRPARVALRAPRQRVFLCAAHGARVRSATGWDPVAQWPDLLAG